MWLSKRFCCRLLTHSPFLRHNCIELAPSYWKKLVTSAIVHLYEYTRMKHGYGDSYSTDEARGIMLCLSCSLMRILRNKRLWRGPAGNKLENGKVSLSLYSFLWFYVFFGLVLSLCSFSFVFTFSTFFADFTLRVITPTSCKKLANVSPGIYLCALLLLTVLTCILFHSYFRQLYWSIFLRTFCITEWICY